MRRIRYHCAISAAMVALAVATPAVAAGAWTLPVSGGEIVTPYAAVYAGKTHRGVDISGTAGDSVLAPADGRVVFAGRVPADGGGTCGAVTIEFADGFRVSVLPLADVRVGQGAEVVSGEAVGTLAAVGDDSSALPHLHLSLRRGDEYLDPTGSLPVGEPAAPVSLPGVPAGPEGTSSTADEGPAPGSSAAATPVGVAAPTSVAVALPAPVRVPVQIVAPVPALSPVPRPHRVPEAAGVPTASQVVVASATTARAIRLHTSGVADVAPGSPAVVAPGILLIAAGAFGLTRQFAHGSIR